MQRIAWLVPILLIGLLLFPSTCAQASMVHSIFTDPASITTDDQRHHHQMPGSGIANEELAEHVVLGHISLGVDSISTLRAVTDDPCTTGPEARSLPQELLINMAGAPAVFDSTQLSLDISEEPDLAKVEQTPEGRILPVELPPPRLA